MYLLFGLGLIGCGGAGAGKVNDAPSGAASASPSGVDPADLNISPMHGDGFLCTGTLCLRTQKACEIIREQRNSGPCEPFEAAQCVSAEDPHNMVIWQRCFTTQEECEEHRVHFKQTEPDYLQYTSCTTRR
ncbi:hypothetical protein [Haliangium sp.]|uniref:hypothetical protein n=1 Tax=Haliangium sp. TaxID=2663208 RepID=UPI003D13F359